MFQNAGIAAAVAAMGWAPKDKAGFEQVATIALQNPGIGREELSERAQRAGVARGTLHHWLTDGRLDPLLVSRAA